MILEKHQEAIVNNLANRLRYIRFESQKLGVEGARQRLLDWLENFSPFLNNLSPCFEVLRSIEILDDREILDGCENLLLDHYPCSEYAHKYTCFGSAYESSARIIRQINSQPEYVPDIEDLVFEEDLIHNKKPVIVFMDDFLNSGNQFMNILDTWSGHRDPEKSKRSRQGLSSKAWRQLQETSIVFVFERCMEEGRQRAEEYIKKRGLKARVLCRQTYQDQIGIFGDENDLTCIRRGIPTQVGDKSIFKGWDCRDVTDFLHICEDAGEALLRKTKPNWPDHRYEERRLGYGNSAKLYVTEANVPTCTLTCVWLGGRIEIDGQEIDWKPILPRREKKEAGSESDSRSLGKTRPSSGSGLLDDYKLDHGQSNTPSFEICLATPAPRVPATFPARFWQVARPEALQGSLAYTGLLRPELLDTLGLSDQGKKGKSSVQILKSDRLAAVNQHLVCEHKGKEYPTKLVTGLMVVFDGVIAYCVARLRIDMGDANIRLASELARQLMFLDESQARRVPLRQKSPTRDRRVHDDTEPDEITVPSLLSWIQAHAEEEGPGTGPFEYRKPAYAVERARSVAYMRETGSLFTQDLETQLAVTGLAASFARSGKNTSTPPKDISTISLDKDAHIGIGNYGALVLCGGDAGINTSYLASDFLQHHLFVYLFALHLEQACVRLRMAGQHGADEDWSEKARAWLRRFHAFPFERACQRPYMQQFLCELESRLGLKELIAETYKLLN